MNPSSESHDWGPLHDLALVYLALTHGADAEIDPSETLVMREKLLTWYPDKPRTKLDEILQQVMLVYMSEARGQMVDASVASLRQALPKGKRIAVLNDLAEIASADGLIVPGEVSFIQQLARIWEVDRELEN